MCNVKVSVGTVGFPFDVEMGKNKARSSHRGDQAKTRQISRASGLPQHEVIAAIGQSSVNSESG